MNLNRAILRTFRALETARKKGLLIEFCSKILLSIWRGMVRGAKEAIIFGESPGIGAEFSEDGIRRLERQCCGLHAQLPYDPFFSYSILMPVFRPEPEHFRVALESCLNQTAPRFEVLVGFDSKQSPAVLAVLDQLKAQLNPEKFGRLKVIPVHESDEPIGISSTTNALAEASSGNLLLLVDHDDWIRPDLLYRYELTLRMPKNHSVRDKTILYCNEYKIDERGVEIRGSHYWKRNADPRFLAINEVTHCLLLAKKIWKDLGGLRSECNGAQDFDLVLRADLLGAHFVLVPLFLYAWRASARSTAKSAEVKPYVTRAGQLALEQYHALKGTGFSVGQGLFPTSFRLIPRFEEASRVHVILLYKDKKEMTLECVAHLERQVGCELRITAVDNGSSDLSIGQTLESRGVEVLRIDEPFNFSRLNNLAFQRTRFSGWTDRVLFLNNDVYLDPGAVQELCRWIDVSGVGAVGGLLRYPDGKVQHGGVMRQIKTPAHEFGWEHQGHLIDTRRPSGVAFTIHLPEGVTGACLMIRREVFEKIGGFDEVYYPIAYSDTDLCSRVTKEGHRIVYTPYATGVHFESVSRKYGSIEDFETSRWLHDQLRN